MLEIAIALILVALSVYFFLLKSKSPPPEEKKDSVKPAKPDSTPPPSQPEKPATQPVVNTKESVGDEFPHVPRFELAAFQQISDKVDIHHLLLTCPGHRSRTRFNCYILYFNRRRDEITHHSPCRKQQRKCRIVRPCY